MSPKSASFKSVRAGTVFVAFCLLSSPACAGEKIVDDANGFTITLPDGFEPNPILANAEPEIIHGFVFGDYSDDKMDIILLIEKMRGTIGRERINAADMPPEFQGRIFTTRWKGFDVDAFVVPEQFDEIETVTYNVQIPLKRAAIQVKLFGALDREGEMKTLLPQILAGVDGESNWLPSAAQGSTVVSSQSYGLILLACAIVFILGGLVFLWFLSRKTPKGTVLLVAVGIYSMGLALAGVRVREVVMLTGALKLLGFTGGILGLIDLLRKRSTGDENAT